MELIGFGSRLLFWQDIATFNMVKNLLSIVSSSQKQNIQEALLFGGINANPVFFKICAV
jgi:hypothetical protein